MYQQLLTWDKRIYKHFYFTGHDNYFDIIAENCKVEKISRLIYSNLKNYGQHKQ